MQQLRQSRTWLTIFAGVLIALLLLYAFWPRAVWVDIGQAKKVDMNVTIDEEARTRVHDTYKIATPVTGRLLRVELEVGDEVIANSTVAARMLPTNPALLDERTKKQGLAVLQAAQAALAVAQAEFEKAQAEKSLAAKDFNRIQQLHAQKIVTDAQLEQAERTARTTQAQLHNAAATIEMRQAELASAQAEIAIYDEFASTDRGRSLALTSPINGRVLQILQKNATTLTAGTPILEVGDTNNDLEIVCELLSTDAVQVSPGNRVIIDNWGGNTPLAGRVERIEPWGFTKYSALGVEEQRVNTIIRFTGDAASRANLGHGYRVEARIIVWEGSDVLAVPSAALFRHQDQWAIFTVINNRAKLTQVSVGHNNGEYAEIIHGLQAEQTVVLYPSPDLTDGVKVTQRKVE